MRLVMKKFFIISLCLISLFAFGKCEHCKGHDIIESTIQCPLCLGYGNVSPAWYNLSIGNTRWMETTYWTGLQTKSNIRHKLFSFKACPFCVKSKKPGSIVWTHLCTCSMGESMNVKSICDYARAKVKSKCKKLDVDMSGLDTGNDEFALNVDRWMSHWQLPPKLFRKLLNEVINNKFDTEGAHCKWDESKYTEKKFKDSEDSDIPNR